MIEQDQLYIDKILSDPDFPSHPRRETGRTKDDKAIYEFFIPRNDFAVDYIVLSWRPSPVRAVCAKFVNSDGLNMKLYLYYDAPTKPGFSPHLIFGSQSL